MTVWGPARKDRASGIAATATLSSQVLSARGRTSTFHQLEVNQGRCGQLEAILYPTEPDQSLVACAVADLLLCKSVSSRQNRSLLPGTLVSSTPGPCQCHR